MVKNQIALQNEIQRCQTNNVNVTTRDNIIDPSRVEDNGAYQDYSVLCLPPINVRAPAGRSPLQAKPFPPGGDLKLGQPETTKAFLDQLADDAEAVEVNSQDPNVFPQVLPIIDISELSWEEREKVLRYLLNKINQSSHQASPKKVQGTKSDAGRTLVWFGNVNSTCVGFSKWLVVLLVRWISPWAICYGMWRSRGDPLLVPQTILVVGSD